MAKVRKYLMVTFGERVKTVRARYAESRATFALRLGVAPGTLRDWEQGRGKPNGSALLLLGRLEEDIAAGRPRELQPA